MNNRLIIAALAVTMLSSMRSTHALAGAHEEFVANMRWCLDGRNNARGHNALVSALDKPGQAASIRLAYMDCQRANKGAWNLGDRATLDEVQHVFNEAQHGCPPCLNR